jgi:hypothetical protein
MSAPLPSSAVVDPLARELRGHLVPERLDVGVDYTDNSSDPILALATGSSTTPGPTPAGLAAAQSTTS